MCTYEQIRSGLGALENLINWDLLNIPQDDSVRDHFIAGMLCEVDMSESQYRIRYQELCHKYHGQYQQMFTDLKYSLLDTSGGRKIALMLMEYPRTALGLRFDTCSMRSKSLIPRSPADVRFFWTAR